MARESQGLVFEIRESRGKVGNFVILENCLNISSNIFSLVTFLPTLLILLLWSTWV